MYVGGVLSDWVEDCCVNIWLSEDFGLVDVDWRKVVVERSGVDAVDAGDDDDDDDEVVVHHVEPGLAGFIVDGVIWPDEPDLVSLLDT